MEFISTHWFVWLGMMVLGYGYVIPKICDGINYDYYLLMIDFLRRNSKMFVFNIVGMVGLVLFNIAAAMFYKSHAG